MALYTTPVFNINLKKLAANYRLLEKLSAPAIPAAVVKDDAYGLGAAEVAAALYAAGCRRFFVAHGSEGEKIRPLVPDAEIYVLQGIGADSLPYFRTARLTPVICSPQMYAFWQQNRIDGIRPLIQVETGLNRLGFTVAELERLAETEREDFAGVLSHLSCADEQAHFMNARQLAAFRAIKARFFPATPATLSASDGVFLGDDFHFDMTRLGAAMYGINTAPYRENQMQNILELKAPVLGQAASQRRICRLFRHFSRALRYADCDCIRRLWRRPAPVAFQPRQSYFLCRWQALFLPDSRPRVHG